MDKIMTTFGSVEGIKEALSSVFTVKCVDAMFALDYEDLDCIKLVISKVLGMAIIAGSLLIKLPQIFNILKAQSGFGISLSSFLLECVGYIITVAYNYARRFPLSTWGEYLNLTAQDMVIIILLFHFSGRIVECILFLSLAASGGYLIYFELVPMRILLLAQAATIPIFTLSKLPQIWQNYSNQHTGLVSGATTFLNFAGSWARVFTTLQEVNDPLILTGFLVGSGLNTVLFFQLIYYYSNTKKAVAEIQKRANSKKKN
eukprot:Nk52_evm6s158 gene=Nk52_evmTU6s158